MTELPATPPPVRGHSSEVVTGTRSAAIGAQISTVLRRTFETIWYALVEVSATHKRSPRSCHVMEYVPAAAALKRSVCPTVSVAGIEGG